MSKDLKAVEATDNLISNNSKGDGCPGGSKRRKVERGNIMKKWYDEHKSDPGPTKDELAKLSLATGLSQEQVYLWVMSERAKKVKATGEDILKEWYEEHKWDTNPCPTREEISKLVTTTGLNYEQIRVWFKNEFKQRQKSLETNVAKLKKWNDEHKSQPYPTSEELTQLASTTGLNQEQIHIWFKDETARRRKISDSAVEKLQEWYDEHKSHPYPTSDEITELASTTGLAEEQINKWYTNKRMRNRKVAGETTRSYQKLSESAVNKLKEWYSENSSNPYPTRDQKLELATTTGLSRKRINSWFENERARKRKAASGPIALRARLSQSTVDKLKTWYNEHESHPFPNKEEKLELLADTNLTKEQLRNWFKVQRRRNGVPHNNHQPLPESAVDKLKEWYAKHESKPFPRKKDIVMLAEETKLTVVQVKNWFPHERKRKSKTV